jgi:NitT/TauT family transport system substrate-binding protein
LELGVVNRFNRTADLQANSPVGAPQMASSQTSKQKRVRWLTGPLILISFVLLLAGCGASEKPGNSPIPVRIAFTNIPLNYLPVILADSLGYYRQAGLSVTFYDFTSGAKSMQALLGRSADVGIGSFDQCMQTAGEGRFVKSFVLLLERPHRAIVVAPKRKNSIRRVEDLQGATVGVGGFGSITHLFLNYVLTKHGLSPDSVKIATIGTGASAVAAIEHQSVDAVVISGTDQIVIRKRSPQATTLLDVTTPAGCRETYGVDAYPAAVAFATETWLQTHPEPARRVAQSIQQALRWMAHHTPEEMWEAMPPHYRGDKQTDLEALLTILPNISRTGVMPAEGAQAVRNAVSLSSPQVREANFDLARTYTNEFLSKE